MLDICRLCLKTFENPNMIITPDITRKIQAILPEINLNIVLNPAICQLCLDLLEKVYEFRTNCLHTEKMLIKLAADSVQIRNIRDLLKVNTVEVENPENTLFIKQEDIKTESDEFDNDSISLNYNSKKVVFKRSSNGYYVCSLCGRYFTYQLHYMAHLKRHGTEDFKCDYCSKSFVKADSGILNNHVIECHFQQGIKCNLCPSVFHSQMRLKRHLEIHERRFKCDTCGSMFKKKATLNEHLRTHSGERQYQCKICLKSFTQHSTMKIHIRSMHSEERPFQCEICGKSFKLKGNHKQHMLTHSKESPTYSCSHCGKGFWARNKLEVHERYHTGERPKICHVCSKSFPGASSLKRHLFIHKELKPFACELCEKTFAQRGNLKIHMKSHRNLND